MSDSKKIDQKFQDFILLQAQNAGLFLGQLAHPANGEKSINLKAAQSVIDSLEMLKAKSVGNLSSDEQALLDKALENLSGLYDTVSHLN